MVLLLLSIGLVSLCPVSADPLSSFNQLDVWMTNGARFDYTTDPGSYYFKLTGGGLNALHITNDPWNAPSGQVNHGSNSTGTFYISDTGGRGYNDDLILMAALNGTPGSNFALKVNSSGYTWTPTADGSLPDKSIISQGIGVNETLTSSNFEDYGPQNWKPCTTGSAYPIYYGQSMSDTSKNFNLSFVDLKVGNLGTNVNQTYNMSLVNRGATRVDYTVQDLGTAQLVFNGYAWCNQSNQGQGVSWTNQNSGTGSSGREIGRAHV